MPQRLLRIDEVREKLAHISWNTLRRLRNSPDFPKPVAITAGVNGVKGWRESDIDAWIATRPTVDEAVEQEGRGA